MNQIFRLNNRKKETLTFYLLITPWLIGAAAFMLGPIIASLVLSFFEWDLISPAKFIGLRNFEEMFAIDPLFWQSLKVTVIYVLFRVPLSLIAALFLALMMNQKIPGIGVFRTIYYLPSVISGVAVSMMWIWIFNPNFGLMNGVLHFFGLPEPGWFSDPQWALPTMILISLYSVGSTAIIFLAGLKAIPDVLYEAAELDGASKIQQLFKITIPQLTPSILFNVIMLTITSFQIFTEGLIITGGGPANATLFFNLYLYENAFSYGRLGYASALAWVLFALTFICAFIVFKSSNRWVYYEGGE
ncbi:carbohydrate ABC transporter permease [Gracilibacillus alcaliphilus]|uniref:carbohydrate ABC transporter permease n=1 Tax=Gracilibacillus alcaliphilus TaxID=1401441 RepID=UPI001EF838E8|nr:sugar ABC transporter permease [Gracilibacillus alcaliphilus]MBM7677634.1 multiple sugar transport system permease protein [Gracilibacillus alcaliphilus]